MKAYLILSDYQESLCFVTGTMLICQNKETAESVIGNSKQRFIEVDITEIKP